MVNYGNGTKGHGPDSWSISIWSYNQRTGHACQSGFWSWSQTLLLSQRNFLSLTNYLHRCQVLNGQWDFASDFLTLTSTVVPHVPHSKIAQGPHWIKAFVVRAAHSITLSTFLLEAQFHTQYYHDLEWDDIFRSEWDHSVPCKQSPTATHLSNPGSLAFGTWCHTIIDRVIQTSAAHP